jgi:hypothetical protein
MAFDSARQRIVLFGGRDSSYQRLGDTSEFDGASRSEVHPSTLPAPRSGACVAYDAGRRTIVVFGGWAAAGGIAETWLWDGYDWTLGPPGPSGRRSCAMTCDVARDAIVLFGGTTGVDDGGEQSASGATWIYE